MTDLLMVSTASWYFIPFSMRAMATSTGALKYSHTTNMCTFSELFYIVFGYMEWGTRCKALI